jgi:glycosyltransferase involved in cell wall biosynthesis
MTGDDDPTAPTERERLEQLAADLQVHERAQFVGPLPRLSRWLAASDPLAVLTKPDARVKGEGFGTSAFEAMLAGGR